MTRADYRTVTETTSTPISRTAHEMMYARYRWAAERSRGLRVLEVGCGAGQGLPYLAKHARAVVGSDVSVELLREARALGDVDLLALDAMKLPFEGDAFDVILMFEMIYYLPDAADALAECRRVLSVNGSVLIVSANPERPDFNPSPFSHRYYGAHQLASLLQDAGFAAEVFGGFPVEDDTMKGRAISLLRRAATRFNLIPKTMSGKTLLKRLVYGRLEVVSHVKDDVAPYRSPESIDGPADRYQVLYAAGRLKESAT